MLKSITFLGFLKNNPFKAQWSLYRGADKSLAPPGRKQVNVSVRMAWIYFGTLPERNLMTARVSILSKSRASLTCLRRAKDLSAPRYIPPGSTFTNSTFRPKSVFIYFVLIWEQTATCATYSINWLVFITEMKSVYSAVRTGYLNKAVCVLYLSENKQRLVPLTALTGWFL